MSLSLDERDALVAGRFDSLHDRFKDRVEEDDFRLRAILDACEPVEGLRVLDVGCGKGRFIRRLASKGARVIGLDPSRKMLLHAAGCAVVRGSGRRLPFAAGVFDVVIAVEVIQHVGQVRPILGELHRVLRPGGALLIIDRNALALDVAHPWLPSVARKWLDERRGRWMYQPGSPLRERWYRPGQLAAELRRWFRPVRVEYLLTPRERERALFRRVPSVRQFVLWEARKPGAGHGR